MLPILFPEVRVFITVANTPFAEDGEQLFLLIGMFGRIPEVVYLQGVSCEIKQLAPRFVQKVNQFLILRTHHGHKLAGCQNAIFGLFGKNDVT